MISKKRNSVTVFVLKALKIVWGNGDCEVMVRTVLIVAVSQAVKADNFRAMASASLLQESISSCSSRVRTTGTLELARSAALLVMMFVHRTTSKTVFFELLEFFFTKSRYFA